MAALDTVRALIQDTGAVPRITDEQLVFLLEQAVAELNAWANTTWTVTDLDTVPCPVSVPHQQIIYLVIKILVIDAELTNADKGIKMVTQDVQLDASTSIARLNRARMLLSGELDKKLIYWIGIKSGGVLKHVGDQWGGA